MKRYLPSSNVSELGRYGEHQVSFYTGLPNISIPLIDVAEGKNSIPISVSYHAGGVLPDQHPGWIGLGWNLSVGGVITRKVNMTPDEFKKTSDKGFYHTYHLLDNNNWNQQGFIESINDGPAYVGGVDFQPDEFSFYLPNGIAGKFYLNHKREWVVESDRPVKVRLAPQDSMSISVPMPSFYLPYQVNAKPKSFAGFIVTDDQGLEYLFGTDFNTVEYSIDILRQNTDDWVATSWHLKKVTFPDKRTADFEYERGDFTAQFFFAIYHNISQKKLGGGFWSPNCTGSTLGGHVLYPYYPLSAIHQYTAGSLISPVYLKRIVVGHTVAQFHSSRSTELRYSDGVLGSAYTKYHQPYPSDQFRTFAPYLAFDEMGNYYQGPRNTSLYMNNLQWRKLDSIVVSVPYLTEGRRSVVFAYNNVASERLTLLSLSMNGNGQDSLTHKFEYNDVISLPGYLSAQTDHWGYYNAIPLNVNGYDFYTSYHNYKVPNKDYMGAGVLNGIIYPTGGMTFFEYEPHDYIKEVNDFPYNAPITLADKQIAGGLRVKKITSYADVSMSSDKILSSKEYYYVSNYGNNKLPSLRRSSGVLGKKAKYHYVDYRLPFHSEPGVLTQEIFSSQSVLTGSGNGMGGHIGYTDVVEKNLDGSYSKYAFSSITDPLFRDEQSYFNQYENSSPYNPVNSNEITRGKLLSTMFYNNADSLVFSRQITYQKVFYEAAGVRSLKARRVLSCHAPSYVLEAVAYRTSTPYSFLPLKETSKTYDLNGGNVVESFEEKHYDTKRNVIEEISLDSKKDTVSASYKYPYNFSGDIYTDMVARNIVTSVIEKKQSLNGVSRFLIRTNYGRFTSESFILPASIEEQIGAHAVTSKMQFNSYDNTANLLEHRQSDGMYTTYLWGYGGQYPIAKIENATYNDILTALGGGTTAINKLNTLNSFFVSDQNVHTITDGLRSSLTNATVNSYTYTPLVGMISKTDSRGITEYYEYDALNRLSVVKDHEGNIIKTYCYNYKGQQVDCGGTSN